MEFLRFLRKAVMIGPTSPQFGSPESHDFKSRLQVASALFVSCAFCAGLPSETFAESFEATLRSESRLSREEGTLRDLLQLLAAAHNVTIQIDPRVNPRARAETPTNAMPLIELLDYLSGYAASTARPLGETVLITPIADADRIVTLASLRQQQLVETKASRKTLSRLRPLRLTGEPNPVTPEELLSKLESREQTFGQPAAERPKLPHDLWNVELTGVTLSEALAFVLVPMGYSFEWNDTGFRLTALPTSITVARDHRLPRGQTAEDAVSLIMSLGPTSSNPSEATNREIDTTLAAIRFRGTALEHERYARLLRPPTRPSSSATKETRYTLRVDEKPAIAVLKSLIAQRFPVVLDQPALQAAGVDLEQSISIEVNQATAEQLLQQIATELGLTVIQDADSLRLVPSR